MSGNSFEFKTDKEKNWLLTLLRERAVDVSFIKKDGSERKMTCTLSETQIPSNFAPKGSERAKSDEVVAVFDLENQGWRSFRWDSITAIHFELKNA